MTGLIDFLKEADLRIGFTEKFQTAANREILGRDTLQKRLILSLHALGTNAGLKRISADEHGESYKDLLYVRRKFIHKDNLKSAVSEVADAIFRIRAQEVWGVRTGFLTLTQPMMNGCKYGYRMYSFNVGFVGNVDSTPYRNPSMS